MLQGLAGSLCSMKAKQTGCLVEWLSKGLKVAM